MALSEHSIQQKIEKSNISCLFSISKPATAGYPAVAGFFTIHRIFTSCQMRFCVGVHRPSNGNFKSGIYLLPCSLIAACAERQKQWGF